MVDSPSQVWGVGLCGGGRCGVVDTDYAHSTLLVHTFGHLMVERRTIRAV